MKKAQPNISKKSIFLTLTASATAFIIIIILIFNYNHFFNRQPLINNLYMNYHGVIIKDSVSVFKDISSQGKPTGQKAQIKELFNKFVFIYETHPNFSKNSSDKVPFHSIDSAEYLLIGDVNKKGRPLGWVFREKVLLKEDAMKNNSGFIKMVSLINKQKNNSDEGFFLHADPNINSRTVHELPPNRPWFVFKEECDWYLLGESPKWTKFTRNDQNSILAGWISKNSTIEWRSWFGMEWDMEAFPKYSQVKIFKSRQCAQNYYSGNHLSKNLNYELIFPRIFEYFEPRIPILDANTINIKDSSLLILQVGYYNNYGKESAYNTGWVAKRNLDGRNQIRIMALVSKTSLFELVGFLTQVDRTFEEGRKEYLARRLPNILSDALKIQTFDTIEESDSFYNYFKNRMGVPIKTSLLRKRIDDLNKICKSQPHKCKEIIDSIRRSKKYLSGVIGSCEMRENSNGTPEVVRYENGECVFKKYWISTNTGYDYAWIPLDYFP